MYIHTDTKEDIRELVRVCKDTRHSHGPVRTEGIGVRDANHSMPIPHGREGGACLSFLCLVTEAGERRFKEDSPGSIRKSL
jgi:hypothetical protein